MITTVVAIYIKGVYEMRKIISLVLCVFLIVSFATINVFADDISQGKVISGTISLPAGITAPSGGMNVSVNAYCDNATPNDQSDDLQSYIMVNIPEGQSQTVYSLTVQDSNIGYYVSAYTDLYGGAGYSNQGNPLVNISNGNADQINIAFMIMRSISGTVNLPNGIQAPVGGVMVEIAGCFNNGTPDNRQDDIWYGTRIVIPENQSQTSYTLRIPYLAEKGGCIVEFRGEGYIPTYYTQHGGTQEFSTAEIIDLSAGDRDGINTTLIKGKAISGVVSLPAGETAPSGGVGIDLNADSDNGTPNDWQDDLHAHAYVVVPEGQSQIGYSIAVPGANSLYTLDYHPQGYCSGRYSANGSSLIDVRDGDQTNINITVSRGKIISGTVSLPEGKSAPAGGLSISVNAYCDNATPNDRSDDLQAYTGVYIPEGRSQATYSMTVPDTSVGYYVSAYTDLYGGASYSNMGNPLVNVSSGSADQINIAFTTMKTIKGIVSLPNGDVAPTGGMHVTVEAQFDNGTPENKQDDKWYGTDVMIPEGQSMSQYVLSVPESNIAEECKIDFKTSSYVTTYYNQQGGSTNPNSAEMVDMSNGNRDNISVTLIKGRTISGIISLPTGETAPAGGLIIDLDAYSENGTPDNRQDDLSLRFNAMIPEGQNQTGYIIMVPASNSGYTLHFGTQGYCWGAYHEGSNYLIDLNSGDKTNVDLSFIHGKTISGVVSLPDGITAPAGGVSVRIESSSDNGTPGTWLDDMGNVANVIIPEGQKQAIYSMEVPESVTGFKMICYASGYITTYYTQQGGTTNYGQAGLVDLSDGSKTGINISLETGNALNVTAVNGTITKNSDKAVYIDGEKVTLTAVPNDGYKFVGWNGDAAGNEPVITVTMDGNKNITALFSKIITKAIVKLQIPKVQKDLNLKPGDQIKIDLSAIFSDGSIEKIENAKWETSNMEVATADNGVISAVGFGKAKVTASFSGKKVTLDIDTRLKSLKFEGKGEIKSSPGKSYKPVLKAVFADGTVKDVTNDSLTKWDSSNDAIAKVSDGIVQNQDKPGVAVITAKFGDRSSKFKIDTGVKKLVVSAKGTIKLQHRGNQVVIKVTAVFEDGTEQDVTNNPLTLWSSSNSNIASVKKGIILPGDKSGPAVITAVYGDKSIKVNVSVK